MEFSFRLQNVLHVVKIWELIVGRQSVVYNFPLYQSTKQVILVLIEGDGYKKVI